MGQWVEGALDAGRFFKIDDMTACLYNYKNSTIKRRKWPWSTEEKELQKQFSLPRGRGQRRPKWS